MNKRHSWEIFSRYRASCRQCGTVRDGHVAPIYKPVAGQPSTKAGECKPATQLPAVDL